LVSQVPDAVPIVSGDGRGIDLLGLSFFLLLKG